MKLRILAVTLLVAVLAVVASAQFIPVWEKSAAKSSVPSWFSTTGSTERGFAYGFVGGNHRLYVVSRNGGNKIVILNAATGDSVGTLNMTGVLSEGTLPINDIEVTDDGIIYAANLQNSATGDSLMIYRWANETATPTVAAIYTQVATGFARLGDKFSAFGSTADNSLKLYFASATSGQSRIVYFTTADNGVTLTPNTLTLTGVPSSNLGGSASTVPDGGTGFYTKGNGVSVHHVDASGAYQQSIPGSIIATGSNALRYVEKGAKKYVLNYAYGAGNHNVRVADVTVADSNATLFGVTPTLGSNANANGTGDMDVRNNGDGTYTIYVLATNNGLGAYTTDFRAAARVKFTLNTSTVPDTLKSTSTVQVRGSKYPLTWGGDSPKMTNVGGDYWNITHTFQVGDTVYYKYFVDWSGNGWEDGSDKQLAVTGDMTLPLAFFNRTTPPYTPTDSLDVWFRVNMRAREDFIPGTDQVQVRGSFNGWSASTPLTREGTSHFYSGHSKMTKAVGPDTIYYKFTFTKGADVNWESISDRQMVIKGDTTLPWQWFNNSPFVPLPNTDTMIVTFRTNLSQAISQRGFTADDTLIVETGYSSTAKEVRRKILTRQGLTFVWQGIDTLVSLYNRPVQYKYFRVKPGKPDQEDLFYDFAWTGDPGDAGAQKRKFTTAVKTVTVEDIATGVLDPRRVPFFPNKTVITRDSVEVTYTVDLRPAIYKLKAGGKLIATNISAHVMSNPDSVLIWGVWMNGPAVGGWDVRGAWGAARRADSLSKMYDNGTHGDAVAGDSIFTLKWMYRKSENATVGQEFKFGVGAFDNEAGFGNNHYENIDDSQAKDTIASQLGSINPTLYPQWDFDLQRPKTSTSVEGEELPMTYSLGQNYPNPFNPATTIQYDLPVQSEVTLKVFNALGQEVATVVTGVQAAGTHRVTFDAKHLATGIYFYQIKAGDFTSLKKMVLIK